MSGDARTWTVSVGCGLGILAVPLRAHASHPQPGSEVPWLLFLVAGVLVFAAAWGLTVFFERRQRGRER